MITVNPSKLNGSIMVPASKSMAHRALICASLAQGKSTINNISVSDDIKATIDCLILLGADISIQDSCAVVNGQNFFLNKNINLDCRESGSTLRFLLPLVAALGVNANFIGHGQLPLRPIENLISELSSHGCSFTNSRLPFGISGQLLSGNYYINTDETTQYVSGLLMALPTLKGNSKLFCDIDNKCSYINLTVEIMKMFGISVSYNENCFLIEGNQTYSPANVSLEGDWSAGAFFHCANALGSNIKIGGLSEDSAQGDKVIISLLERIKTTDNIVIDALDCPDLVPLLALTSCFMKKNVKIDNISRLRYKESDRIDAVSKLLTALGGNIHTDSNSMVICPSDMHGGNVYCLNDHRIIMAAVLASTVVDEPVNIIDGNNISKSYPDFFKDYITLGGNVNEFDLG